MPFYPFQIFFGREGVGCDVSKDKWAWVIRWGYYSFAFVIILHFCMLRNICHIYSALTIFKVVNNISIPKIKIKEIAVHLISLCYIIKYTHKIYSCWKKKRLEYFQSEECNYMSDYLFWKCKAFYHSFKHVHTLSSSTSIFLKNSEIDEMF